MITYHDPNNNLPTNTTHMFNFAHWEKINEEIKTRLLDAGRIEFQDEVVEQELYLSAEDCLSFCKDLCQHKSQLRKDEMRRIFWLLLLAQARMSKDGILSSLPQEAALFLAPDREVWFKSIMEENHKPIEGLKSWTIMDHAQQAELSSEGLDSEIIRYNKILCDELKRGPIKPIICYALDDTFMPKELYKKWDKLDKKQYIEKSDREEKAACGASFLLYWIRKFFAKGNGKNYFEIFKENSPAFHQQIIRLLKKEAFGYWYNKLIPNDKKHDIAQWMKSQCWALSCNEVSERSLTGKNKGETSTLRQNNELVYNYVNHMSDYFTSGQEDSVEISISIEDLSENAFKPKKKECPEYLRYIWENHREEYLQFLKALTSTDEKPEHVIGSYLGVLWGREKDIQDNIFHANWELDINGNICDLYIHYSVGSKIGRAFLSQDDNKLPLSSDKAYVAIADLYKKGFVPSKGIKLCAEKAGRAHDCTINGWDDNNPLIFSANKLKRLQNGAFASQLYILRSSTKKPRVTFDNQPDSAPLTDRPRRISYDSDHELYCDLYELPENIKTQCQLSINGKHVLKLTRAPELRLLNAETMHIYKKQRKDYSKKFVVGDRAECELPYGVGHMRLSSNELAELSPVEKARCTVTLKSDKAYYQSIEIHYAATINSSPSHRGIMTIIFLPVDWKNHCCDLDLETEIKYAREGYNSFFLEISGKRQHLVTPIQENVRLWELDEKKSRETLTSYTPDAQLTVFGMRAEQVSLTLLHKGKKSIVDIDCNRSHDLDDVLRHTGIQASDAFALHLGDICLCQCCYLPESIQYLERDQDTLLIYAHPDRRMNTKLIVKHESEIIRDDVSPEHEVLFERAEFSLDSDAFVWDEYHRSALPTCMSETPGWFSLEIRPNNQRDREYNREIKVGSMHVAQRLKLTAELWEKGKENVDLDYPKLTEEINAHFKIAQAEGISLSKLVKIFNRAEEWQNYQNSREKFKEDEWSERDFPIEGLFHHKEGHAIKSIKFQPTRKGKELWLSGGKKEGVYLLKQAFVYAKTAPISLLYYYKESKREKIVLLQQRLSKSMPIYAYAKQHSDLYREITVKAIRLFPHVGRVDHLEPQHPKEKPFRIHGVGSLVIHLSDLCAKRDSPMTALLMLAVLLNFKQRGLAEEKLMTMEEQRALCLLVEDIKDEQKVLSFVLKLSLHLFRLLACLPCE